MPKALAVTVIHCKSLEEVATLYMQLNSAKAACTPVEELYSAWHHMGFVASSDFFSKKSGYKQAVALAVTGKRFGDARHIAKLALPYVKALDTLNQGLSRKTPAMVVAAALVAVKYLMDTQQDGRVWEVGAFLRFLEVGAGATNTVTGHQDAVALLFKKMTSVVKGDRQFELALAALSMWLCSGRPVYSEAALQPMTRELFLKTGGQLVEGVAEVPNVTQEPEAEAPVVTAEVIALPTMESFVEEQVVSENTESPAPTSAQVFHFSLPPAECEAPVSATPLHFIRGAC